MRPDEASRRPDIQGLRGIAVLLVVVFHAGLPLPGGFVGVDVFFVISGYVITAMIVRQRASGQAFRYRDFALRRVRRLLPALALTVSVTLVCAVFLLSPLGPFQQTAITGAGALVGLANLAIARTSGGYFQPAAETNALLNTWSLSVEEQFYIVFPWLLLLGWRIGAALRGRFRSSSANPTLVLVSIVTLLSLAACLWAATRPALDGSVIWGFYSPFLRAWEFGFGAIAALTLGRRPKLSQRGWTVASMVGIGLIGFAALVLSPETRWPGTVTLVPVLGTTLLLAAGERGAGTGGVLGSRWLCWIGDRSYSWYLWHWPFIVLAAAAIPGVQAVPLIAGLLSLLVAAVTYRTVEQPLRYAGTSSVRPLSATFVAWAFVVPSIAALALSVGSQRSFWNSDVLRLQEATSSEYVAVYAGCDDPFGERGEPSASCWWHRQSDGRPIYLLGDSQALQYSDGLVEAARQAGRPIAVWTATGCPLVESAITRDDRGPEWQEGCAAWRAAAIRWLSEAPEGDVVLANSDQYWTDPEYLLADTRATPQERVAALEAALPEVLGPLRDRGHAATWVLPIPRFATEGHRWDPSSCSLFAVVAGRCRGEALASELLDVQAGVRRAIHEAGETFPVTVVDVTSQICPSGRCATATRDRSVYANAGHVTRATSLELAGGFSSFLASPSASEGTEPRPEP